MDGDGDLPDWGTESQANNIAPAGSSQNDHDSCKKIDANRCEDGEPFNTNTEPDEVEIKWTSGSCSKLGPRNTNEDRFVVLDDLTSFTDSGDKSEKSIFDFTPGVETRRAFYAVYDGHCGAHAATFLQSELHSAIIRHENFASDIETAIFDSCTQADDNFLSLCREKRLYSGTTVLGAFIVGRRLIVFNIGDCQAVLCRSGKAISMSDSHKPDRSDEKDRIERAGGWITQEKELYMGRLHRMDLSDPLIVNKAQEIKWVTIHRVCGELAITQSFSLKTVRCTGPATGLADSWRNSPLATGQRSAK